MFGSCNSMKAAINVIQSKLDSSFWIPPGMPSPPSRPISDWFNDVDKVRRESKVVLDHFLVHGQAIGTGRAPFWNRKVDVQSLPGISKKILGKHGFKRSTICLEDIVNWEALWKQPWAKGPSKEHLKIGMGWKNFLIVVFELLLSLIGVNSETHSTKRLSSLDFVSPTPLKKLKPVERMREVAEVEVEKLAEDEGGRMVKRQRAPAAPAISKEIFFRSDSEEEEDIFTSPVASSTPALELQLSGVFTQPCTTSFNSGEVMMKPVLEDWLKFGDLFDTLTDWASSSCHLQVVKIDLDPNGIPLVLLHDSESTVQARFHPRYTTDLKFLRPGSILNVKKTSGSSDGLVIVSFFCSDADGFIHRTRLAWLGWVRLPSSGTEQTHSCMMEHIKLSNTFMCKNIQF